MTVQQPTILHHGLPLWSELLGAAIIGGAILFGILLVAGHSDLLPWTTTDTSATTPAWMMEEPAAIPPHAR
jgi:hypothetical protein